MPISKNIAGLTALALRDRVLTYKERQVIVGEAMKEGISEKEINSYLDNALTERLKTFSKEDLKRCPYCGAQIPLISDVCLFCGQSLESHGSQDDAPPPVYVSGKAAKIIQEENRHTATSQHEHKTCPDCGAPYPLVSNICTQCGHVFHEMKDSDMNVQKLIDNIQHNIDELQSVPQPTFKQVFLYRKPVWVFLLALLILIVAMQLSTKAFDGNMESYSKYGIPTFASWLISFLLLIWSIAMVRESHKSEPPSKTADDKFFAALHRKEMFENQIVTLYGDNMEAKELLNQYSAKTDAITKERKTRQRKLIGVVCIFIALNILPIIVIDASYGELEVDTTNLQSLFIDHNMTPYIYRLWDEKHHIIVNGNHAAQYVSVTPTAELSIDMDLDEQATWFRLRISNIYINSTGTPFNREGRQLALRLIDNADKPQGSPFNKLLLQDEHKLYDDLEKGKGGSFAEFISEPLTFTPDTASVDGIMQMVQNIQSCSIYITN